MKNNKKPLVQEDLIVEFFKKNSNRDISHPEVVDWVVATYKRRTGNVFRDPDRAIRKLSQSGFLIKIANGVYKYDPKKAYKRDLQDFTAAQKKVVLKRDGYKCAQCGIGKREGAVLHIDHVIPKDWGGEAIIENAQILCSRCNFLKKNLKQTESGKKMFIRMYKMAKKEKNKGVLDFCMDLLEVYEKHKVNGRIEWQK